jgi:ATP-dependent DNA ligase
LIVESLARLRSHSCIIDGEAVACDESGVPSFERIRYRRHDTSVFLYAFDLIELNGDDLRRDLHRLFSNVGEALAIIKPETVVVSENAIRSAIALRARRKTLMPSFPR